jgi:hypothetical protein
MYVGMITFSVRNLFFFGGQPFGQPPPIYRDGLPLHVIDFFAMQTIFHELSIGYRILGRSLVVYRAKSDD